MVPQLEAVAWSAKKCHHSRPRYEWPRERKMTGRAGPGRGNEANCDAPSYAHSLDRFRRDQFQQSRMKQPQNSTTTGASRGVADQTDNLAGYQKTARTVVSKNAAPLKPAAQLAPPLKRPKTEVLADYRSHWKTSAVDREAVRLVPMSPLEDLTWCSPRYELEATKTAASWRNAVPLSDESEQSVWVSNIQADDIAAVFF